MLGLGHEESGRAAATTGSTPLPVSASFDLQEAVRAPRAVNRRTQEEVRRLVLSFKEFFHGNPPARERLQYFWPDVEQQDACLATLAHDIPSGEDPLSSGSGAHYRRGLQNSKKRKFSGSAHTDCVHWLGLVNKINRYAAVQLKLPETFEPWVTYTNRLMVYLFARIPHYQGPDDFAKRLNVSGADPFPMKCKNSLCVRLSHIKYQLRSHRSEHVVATPERMARAREKEDDESESESEESS